MSQEVRDAFDAMPFDLAVMRMFAHAEGAFTSWLRFGRAVMAKNSLERAICEVVVCVATAADSPTYEHAWHRVALLAAGCTEEQVVAIEQGELRSPCLSPREQAAAVFASEVHANVRASDEALADVRQHFSDRQIVEMILCVGQYMLNSRVAENTGVSLEDDRRFAKPGQFVPEARRAGDDLSELPEGCRLTETDENGIRRTLAEYCALVDDGDFEGWAALFATDGVLKANGDVIGAGRDGVLRWVTEAKPSRAGGKHLTVNSVIQVQGNAAEVSSDFCFLAPSANGPILAVAGRYVDVLIREADAWRFAEREILIPPGWAKMPKTAR